MQQVMQAIIVTGGKQYNVSEGDTLFIEKLDVNAGDAVVFDQVLAIVDGENSKFGTPVVEGAKVDATVVKNGKGKKIRIFKYTPKKGYRKRQGHRQPYTDAPDSESVIKERQVQQVMQAIIVTGGKQYNVSEGDTLFIEKLDVNAGDAVVFDQVLAIVDGENSKFGTPVVEGAKVDATVVKNGKGKKIRIFKYTPKKGYRKRQGHRQPYTKVEIGKISF